ncbi:hypothetical protein C2E23DRAFT_863842 [Lenzites betulinus]|nr:hypothetical protein C2E23DRAFT_863842 [Lenzites betulinus]
MSGKIFSLGPFSVVLILTCILPYFALKILGMMFGLSAGVLLPILTETSGSPLELEVSEEWAGDPHHRCCHSRKAPQAHTIDVEGLLSLLPSQPLILTTSTHSSEVHHYYARKNPVIIGPKCDLHLAGARRILWRRFSNAGQWVTGTILFMPHGPENSDFFTCTVSAIHATRIKRLLDEATGTIVPGGDANVSQHYVAPTIVKDVEHPLGVYVFCPNTAFQSKDLYGYYARRHMFDEFAHHRVSVNNPGWYAAS